MSDRRRKYIWLMVAALLMIGFQNCGEAGAPRFEDVEVTEKASFFNYPYKSAPRFYAHLSLFKSTSGAAKYSILAAASYPADTSLSIAYQVRFIDGDGADACSPNAGTLASGQSTIQVECQPVINPSSVRVEVTLTAGTSSEVLAKSY